MARSGVVGPGCGIVGAGRGVGDAVDEDEIGSGVLLTELLLLSVAFDLCEVLAGTLW